VCSLINVDYDCRNGIDCQFNGSLLLLLREFFLKMQFNIADLTIQVDYTQKIFDQMAVYFIIKMASKASELRHEKT
jgi:hypothetical protein